MDIVQIVFLSAVIFPVIATGGIMLFVKSSVREMKDRKLDFEKKDRVQKRIITSLEKVVENQDSVLEAYRDTHS
jgi:hypothetical protein